MTQTSVKHDAISTLTYKIDRDPQLTRERCAELYAKVLGAACAEEDFRIGGLNEIIIEKWSRYGLSYIKALAWKIYGEGKR